MSKSVFSIMVIVLVGSLFGGCASSTQELDSSNGFVLREEDELAQFEKVRVGMTADEVDAILGKPRLANGDSRYYGHTPRIRPIDSPYSLGSIIIRMQGGVVAKKQYVPDHPDAPGSKWSRSNEADCVLQRLDREWRDRWTATDDPKSLYSRKAFAAQNITMEFGEIEASAVLAAIDDDELTSTYSGVIPWMSEPLVMYLARGNDTPRLTKLLSEACLMYVSYDVPIEVWLACAAPTLGCPEAFGCLLEAYGQSRDPKNAVSIALALRDGWASMGWDEVESDAEMVAKFTAWYETNKDKYEGNRALMTVDRQGTDEPRWPLFVPK